MELKAFDINDWFLFNVKHCHTLATNNNRTVNIFKLLGIHFNKIYLSYHKINIFLHPSTCISLIFQDILIYKKY